MKIVKRNREGAENTGNIGDTGSARSLGSPRNESFTENEIYAKNERHERHTTRARFTGNIGYTGLSRCILLLLAAALLLGVAGCAFAKASDTTDLTKGVSASNDVTGRRADAEFIGSVADFSIDLFKESITGSKNSLVSPLSVMLALAMTTNGADGETLSQMEALLGGSIPLDMLNEYLYSYANSLPNAEKSKMKIVNSIWFRGDEEKLKVEPEFLQKNADYYDAAAYRAAFDNQTVKDINAWVGKNTDGMIDKMLEEITGDAMLYLINAIVFDAEWQSVYFKENVRKEVFTDISSLTNSIDFMYSTEYGYLDDGMATGFIKPYAGGGYSFAALLPNEDVAIEAYIESLTGESFLDIINSAQKDLMVFASMPKFEYDYEIRMNDALMTLGISDAFNPDAADFNKMGRSSYGNLFIDRVLHKTFISVDELGTKAGAVTMVAMSGGGSGASDYETVHLNRPFVYAIIDNATNLPIFIGTLMTV